MRNAKILIAGCGQIGSRHLQAISSLEEIAEITVYDPFVQALELGKERVGEINDLNPSIKFNWTTSLEDVTPGGDLCIVPTQAKGRVDLVKTISKKLGIKKFLIEKIVAQSVEDYESLLHFAKEQKLQVWVNYKSRAHPSHQHIKSNLVAGAPVDFNVTGGNHGLANNGCHVADLFAFYSGSKVITPLKHHFDDKLHPSTKRKGTYDLSGMLTGIDDKGSHFCLTFSGVHDAPPVFSVTSSTYRAVVDDFAQWLVESKKENGWKWEGVPFHANMSISFMAKKFVADILNGKATPLPSLEDAFVSHKFILEALKPQFEKLLNKELGFCPVT